MNILLYHENDITIPSSHRECTHDEFTSWIAGVRGFKHLLFILFICMLLLQVVGNCLGNWRLACYNTLLVSATSNKVSSFCFKSPCYRRNGLNHTNAQHPVFSQLYIFMTVFIHKHMLPCYKVTYTQARPLQLNQKRFVCVGLLGWQVRYQPDCSTCQWPAENPQLTMPNASN